MNTTYKYRMPFSIIALLLTSMLIIACDGHIGDDEGENSRRQQIFSIYPPNVFLADKEVNDVDELFAAFSDGSEIIKLSDSLVAGGDVAAIRFHPIVFPWPMWPTRILPGCLNFMWFRSTKPQVKQQ